jgi:hypothetical protein
MRRYLLRCIEENPAPGDHLHGGYEAAWELAAALKQWRRARRTLAATCRGVALDFEKHLSARRARDAEPHPLRRHGARVRRSRHPAVLCVWERDEDLRDAYKLAVEWGSTHENRVP